MVVPTESFTSSKSNRKFVGNDQVIVLKENRSRMNVIGNGCTVKIDRNEAPLKIIGNQCHVEVKEGSGSISYIGNNGEVKIGGGVQKRNVCYTGNGGRIIRKTEQREEEIVKVQEFTNSASETINLTNQNSVHITHISSAEICSNLEIERIIRDEVMKRKRSHKSELKLDLNKTSPDNNVCPSTMMGGEGVCKYLHECPEVHYLITNVHIFQQYHCAFNGFAAICCPHK